MSEKSGIELLEEILYRINALEKSVKVLDNNIKTIMNAVNLADLINGATKANLKNWSAALPKVKKEPEEQKKEKGFKNFKFAPVDASKIKQSANKNRSSKTINNIMVNGRVKIEKGGKTVPLPSVSVKIFDDRDKLVKQTKTNRAGHWMSQLPPGKYVALLEGELDGKKLLPQNKNFIVPDKLPPGQNSIEII